MARIIIALSLLVCVGCATGIGNFEQKVIEYREDGSIAKQVVTDCEGIMFARGQSQVCGDGKGAEGGETSDGFVDLVKGTLGAVATFALGILKFIVPAGLAAP